MIKLNKTISILLLWACLIINGCSPQKTTNSKIQSMTMNEKEKHITFYEDYDLFQMEGIKQMKNNDKAQFPRVEEEIQDDGRFLKLLFNKWVKIELHLDEQGEAYNSIRKYRDDDASQWIEYISIKNGKFLKANLALSDDEKTLFLNELWHYDKTQKKHFFFPERQVVVSDYQIIDTIDWLEKADYVEQYSYTFTSKNKELLVKKRSIKNLIDDEDVSECTLIQQSHFSFLWDVFFGRKRGDFVEVSC